jgi:replicative DNA helicase
VTQNRTISVSRPLPHSLEAEEYLLSCCMIEDSDSLAVSVAAGITPDAFYDSKHAIVFASLCRLLHGSKPIAVHILAEELKTSGELDQIGGYTFLTQVSSRIPTSAQAGFFIEKVIELATLRNLIRSATRTVEDCHTWAGGDVHELVEQSAGRLMTAAPSQGKIPSWHEAIASVQAKIDQLNDPVAQHVGEVSFGFSDLDRMFQPMRGGQLVILAARPSVGKSSLARMIAYHNAEKWGRHVIFASLEVMAQSLAINLAQTITGLPYRTLKKAHDKDVALFRSTVGSLAMPALHVLAATEVRLATIRAKAKLMRAKGTPARLIVVDYLTQLPDAEPQRGENRATSVGRCSRALKKLAIEEDCPVLALAQLNRDSAKDGREPALHDLRESGDIEQDADKVIFLHRPSDHPITKANQPENSLPHEVPSFGINAIQAKGRDDGTAIVTLNFRRAITRFEQIAK